MGFPKPRPIFTIDQYLAIEREAEERHEFVDGQIFAMAGESSQHGDISYNIVGLIFAQLKGKQCRGRTKDTKVRSGPGGDTRQLTSGMFSYPDVVVICDEPEYHDAHTDVILNPTAIIEVLSPSTESFDRGEKFKRYQTWNPTLLDYLLVAQDQAQIEHYSRLQNGSWSYTRHEGWAAEVAIRSIDCTLKLVDVYDRVEFPPK